MQYKLASWYDNVGLERKVNELCKEGWRPQGGIAINPKDAGAVFYQAMVKDDEDDFEENNNVVQVMQG